MFQYPRRNKSIIFVCFLYTTYCLLTRSEAVYLYENDDLTITSYAISEKASAIVDFTLLKIIGKEFVSDFFPPDYRLFQHLQR